MCACVRACMRVILFHGQLMSKGSGMVHGWRLNTVRIEHKVNTNGEMNGQYLKAACFSGN